MEATEGRFTDVVESTGLFAVHGMLMPNGNVLLFSGSAEVSELATESFEWDPSTDFSTAQRASMPGVDLFCSHHATLDDGRILVVGGSDEYSGRNYHGDWGTTAVCVYDPSISVAANRWSKIGDMREPRWYPTLVKLPDGTFVTFSGIIRGNTHASTAEYLKPPFTGPGYSTEAATGGDKSFPSYPGMLLVRGGKVVHVGTTWQYRGSGTTSPIGTFSFRKTGSTTGVWVDEGVSPHVDKREEGTFVLLPPAQDGKILLLGGGHIVGSSQTADAEEKSAEILHTQESPMRWQRISPMEHPRINASTVLLPDGRVLVLGGHDSFKGNAGLTPSNQAEIYNPILGDDPAAWQSVATLGEPRQYHSCAMLLKDGRVLIAGGVANDGSNQFSLEFYEPSYFNGARPVITAIHREDGPDDEISYGGLISIETSQASDIRKIALTRLGSMTHHTDTEQRYVALPAFIQHGTDRLEVGIINDPSVAPPGYYLLWIVDDQNCPCREAIVVRLSSRRCRIITDRSHVSQDELNPTTTTTFNNAFYVAMDGFVPSELGVTTATPRDEELEAIAPIITFRSGFDEFSVDLPSISGIPQKLLLEDDTLPSGVRQTVTFKYRLQFSNDDAFVSPDGSPIELRKVFFTAVKENFNCVGDLTLINQPNPFMLDGETHWLSTDVRVFQIRESEKRFGEVMGNTSSAATTFIQNVLGRFRKNNAFANAEFDTIRTDSNASRLELSRSVGGRRVFNFAIAKVRYRGQTLNAENVRVFFRMFRTAATNLEYRVGSTYRRETNPITDTPVPVLGTRGGELATIPFFADTRVDTSIQPLAAQTDDTNMRTIHANAGTEVTEYFGCWLDFNQSTLRYPPNPTSLGPFATGLQSIQDLIRGQHQCLVAEVHFAGDPILEGQTPSSNDNLSQRNLLILESDNPGETASHTVEHTFEISGNKKVGIGKRALVIPEFVIQNEHGDHEHHSFPQVLHRGQFDDLMIQWGNLPRDANAELYIPSFQAEDLIRLGGNRSQSEVLTVVDDNTIGLQISQVSYVSLPPGSSESIPALLTIRLPDYVNSGQKYNVDVFQIEGATQKILGAFNISVSVSTADRILAREVRTLSVLKHIASKMFDGDIWRPIFDRHLNRLGEKVRSLGVDPNYVHPSPDGDGLAEEGVDSAHEGKGRKCLVTVLVIAFLFGLMLGLLAILRPAWGMLALTANLVLIIYWIRKCGGSLSRIKK